MKPLWFFPHCRRWVGLALILAGLTGVVTTPAFSVESRLTFEAEGKAHVKSDNYVRGRALATDYAFKNALALALVDVLGESAYRRKRSALQKMIDQPKKFIQRYRFLEYYDSEVEQFSRVKLEVTFYPEAINRELSSLGILASLVRPNTTLVLVSEKSFSAEATPDFWEHVPISEVAMIQKFLAGGVKVIPRAKLNQMIDEGEAYEAIQGDLEAAVDIGLKAKVDIVIVGSAVTTRLGEPDAGGLTTIQANLTLRAISTTRSTVIAARSDFATVQAKEDLQGELEAFEVVGNKMADFFLETMKRFWEPKPEPEPGLAAGPGGEAALPEDAGPLGAGPEDTRPGDSLPSKDTPPIMEDL